MAPSSMIRCEGVMVEFFSNRRSRPVARQQNTLVRQFQHALPHGVQMRAVECVRIGPSDRSGKEGVANETHRLRPGIDAITDAARGMTGGRKATNSESS